MTNPLRPRTDAELDELELLEREATAAPWDFARIPEETKEAQAAYVAGCIAHGEGHFHIVMTGDASADVCHTGNGPRSNVNGRLITALRNALPSLLAELRASRSGSASLDAQGSARDPRDFAFPHAPGFLYVVEETHGPTACATCRKPLPPETEAVLLFRDGAWLTRCVLCHGREYGHPLCRRPPLAPPVVPGDGDAGRERCRAEDAGDAEFYYDPDPPPVSGDAGGGGDTPHGPCGMCEACRTQPWPPRCENGWSVRAALRPEETP